ncbi:MAG: hypothetical protein AUI36_06800 [Cyanobacteria bacterium 13_1_40CM_2_61_4]|nr:MAG: hypothetical protein AUI36_06800 [Cyanobacteria bacterium 13_1_40CM_2_61_4]
MPVIAKTAATHAATTASGDGSGEGRLGSAVMSLTSNRVGDEVVGVYSEDRRRGLGNLVDPRGFEPLTFRLPV